MRGLTVGKVWLRVGTDGTFGAGARRGSSREAVSFRAVRPRRVLPPGRPGPGVLAASLLWGLSGLSGAAPGGGSVPGGEERLHDRSHSFCFQDQVEVAAVIDVKLAVRHRLVHDPGVGQRGARVVVARRDQGGPPQPRQQREAGPAGQGYQLVEGAPGRARACHRVQQIAGGPGILMGAAAEQFTGDAGRITGVQVRRGVSMRSRMRGSRAPSARLVW
jgi:hypothetical protein